MPMNIHDEIQCPCRPDVVEKVAGIVRDKVESYREKVPLIGMKWNTNTEGWSK